MIVFTNISISASGYTPPSLYIRRAEENAFCTAVVNHTEVKTCPIWGAGSFRCSGHFRAHGLEISYTGSGPWGY